MKVLFQCLFVSFGLALLVAQSAAPARGELIECPGGKLCHVEQPKWCGECTRACDDGTWTVESDVCPVSTNRESAEQIK